MKIIKTTDEKEEIKYIGVFHNYSSTPVIIGWILIGLAIIIIGLFI